MPWALHWNGEIYREADITLDQAERIEDLIGVGWTRLNVLRMAKHARATLAVMVSERTGAPIEHVLKDIGKIPVNKYADEVFQIEDDDLPTEYENGNPPPGADPSTST